MIKILHRMEWFLALVFIQVLVLNQMHIQGYAIPFLYIYFRFSSRSCIIALTENPCSNPYKGSSLFYFNENLPETAGSPLIGL